MQRSESINDLAAALAKAQGAMAAAAKDGTNPHLRAKYVTLGSIWEACRAALSAQGLAVSQSPALAAGAVTVETLLMHAGGQWVSSSITIPCLKPEAQTIGAAITYGRKYGLAAIVGVAPEDEESALIARAGKPGMATEEQIALIYRLSGEIPQDERVLRAGMSRVYGQSEPYLLTTGQADSLAGDLRLQLARRNGSGATERTHTPPPPAPSSPPAGGASATLQDGLAAVQRDDVASGRPGHVSEEQALKDLLSLRDSFFGLAPPQRADGESEANARARAWVHILAKRGVWPLTPPPPDVVRELTCSLERKIAELAERQRAQGITCAAKEAPAVTQGAKS